MGSNRLSNSLGNSLANSFDGYSVPAVDNMSVAPNALWSLAASMRTAYAGALFRVRRSSDNAEANIGFVAGTKLVDTAALAAHCGASNGFVVTVYDQSGNSRDLTQATTTNQPKCYDGATGAITLGTSLVAMSTLDAGDFLSRGDLVGLGTSSGGTFWAVARSTGAAASRVLSLVGPATVANQSLEIISSTLTSITYGIEGASRTFTAPDLSAAARSIIMSLASGGAQIGTATAYVDGVALSEASSVNPTNVSNVVGAQTRWGWNSSSWLGTLGTLAIFPGSLSAGDRAILDAIKSARYG